METVFKKGDKVFCILYGHGTVLSIDTYSYPIVVLFESGNEEVYTNDGCYDNNTTATLSFTEYTLEGFSQDRPEELPKKGDICWVRDSEDDDWMVAHFVEYVKDGEGYPYRVSFSPKYIVFVAYRFLTTKKPYANEHN